MEQLKRLFEQGRSYAGTLLDKLSSGQFLSEKDIFDFMRFFDDLLAGQKRCADAFAAETGCSAADFADLNAMEQHWAEVLRRREQQSKLCAARRTVDRFLAISSRTEVYSAALEACKETLRSCSDDELVNMLDSDRLDPYARFADCVLAPDDVRRDMVDDALTAAFGFQLGFALLKGAFELTLDEPSDAPQVESASANEPAPQEKPASDDEPAPQEEPASVEEPAPQEEPASDDEPAPQVEPASVEEPAPQDSFDPVPVLPDEAFGEMQTESGKPPKGFSSLASFLKKQHWTFHYAASCLLGVLMDAIAVDEAYILGHLPEDVPAHNVAPLLNRFLREGYVLSYTHNGKTLYTLSRAGREILSTPTTQQKLHWNTRRRCYAKELTSPACFERYAYSLDQFLVTPSSDIDFSTYMVMEHGFPIFTARFSLSDRPFAIFAPLVCAYSEAGEPIRAHLDNLRTLAGNSYESCCVILTVPAAQLEEWKAYIAAHPDLTAGRKVYFGVFGEDRFIAEDGSESDLGTAFNKSAEAAAHSVKDDSADEFPVSADIPADDADEPDSADAPADDADEPDSADTPADDADEPDSADTPADDADEPVSADEPVDDADEPVSADEPAVDADEPVSADEPADDVDEPVPADAPADDEDEPVSAVADDDNSEAESPSVDSDGAPAATYVRSEPESPIFDPFARPAVADCGCSSFDDGSETSAALADRLLRHPDPLSESEALHNLLVHLVCEGQPMEATVLAATVADAAYSAEFRQFCRALLHSLNLPLEPREYSNAYLEQSPDDGDPLLRYCRVAFMFWALCFPQIPYDHNLYNNVRSLGDMELDQLLPGSDADTVELLTALKQALALLTDDLRKLSFDRLDGLGFSASVRSLLLSDSVMELRRQKLMTRASEKSASPRSSIGIGGLEAFLKDILGPTSLLGTCMNSIATGRSDRLEEGRAFLNACTTESGVFNADFLNDFIDDSWNALRRRDRTVHLKSLANDSPARNLTMRELESRLSILAEWFQRGDPVAQNLTACAQSLKAINGKLQKHLADALASCSARCGDETLPAVDRAGLRLLCEAIAGVCAVLRGERDLSPDPQVCFAPLLTSCHMLLDSSGYPLIDSALNELPGMEPWRLMLEHIRAERCTLEQALERIETQGLDASRYEDYGSAVILRQVLGLPPADYFDLCIAALTDCRNREESFRSDVRLACAYGQIAESTKETAFAQAAKFRPLFIREDPDADRSQAASGENYAHFRRMLDALQTEIQQDRCAREADFRRQLDIRMAGLSPLQPVPGLLEHIREEIDSGNFAMTEQYLNRYDAGETDAAGTPITADVDFHAQFLECADFFCEQCERPENRGRLPSDWGGRVLRSKNFWSNRNERNTDSLLNYWIIRMGASNTPAQIARFLNMLGIPTGEVQLNRNYPATSQYEVFQAAVTPAPSGQADYAHPISRFGTKQNTVLNIVCLYGCKGAATLVDIMTQKIQLSDTSIVLMDGVLSTLERRKIATRFKATTSGQNSFLLIDRVLLLYLAALDRGSQLTAMLQCTLPYTYEQLYTEGSGPVADEMFIGRISERKSLEDPNGACLVYGGRQLGKTALLRRVESCCKSRKTDKNGKINEKPSLSAYIDIKDKRLDFLVSELNRKLSEMDVGGQPLLAAPCASLQEICRAIAARREEFQQLTILVDESDSFFEEIAPMKYEPLHPIVTLRQELGNRVKFVFAGTHNVAATASALDDNSDILQFGKPLCIEPLSAADATRLIRLPLSYLGFSIGERQIALILANTNSYPGLIHLFCSSLIKSVCDNYGTYYSESRGNPPYTVSDEQLKAIFRETDIKREIERRVIATIKLDRKYRIVSNLMAYLEYDAQEQGAARLYGYTPHELMECNQAEFEIPDFMPDRMRTNDLDALMSEMEKMGILWKQPDTARYRFRQRDFLGYIGTADQVMNALLYEERGDDAS